MVVSEKRNSAAPSHQTGLACCHQEAGGKGKEITTMTNLERIRKQLSPARRKKIEARAAQLIAEEVTLQELRHARKLTQVRMAKAFGIGQGGVSRLEKRADLMISTLRKTVEAMGDTLSLVAEFPGREPVVLSGIAGEEPAQKPAGRRHAHASARSITGQRT
jgi:Helix-turn-helix domain